MKPRLYVLLSIVFLLIANTCLFAQDDAYGNDDTEPQTKEKKQSGKKINTGYVFIDGKYVEPPYIVKLKKRTIYINGIPITKKVEKNKIKDSPSVRKDPGIPPDIKQMDSINVIYKAKIQPYNISYMEAKLVYLYKNYSEEDAVKLTKEYLESMPNIKSVKGSKICEVEAYNGEKRNIILTTDSFKDLKNGRKKQLKSEGEDTKNVLLYMADRYEQRLLKGDVFFIFSDSTIYCDFIEMSYSEKNGIQLLKDLSEIINDTTIFYNEKIIQIEYIMKNSLMKKYIPSLIKNFSLPMIKADTLPINNNVNNYLNRPIKATFLDDTDYAEISYSPKSNTIHIASPDPWSNRYTATSTFNIRVNQIVDLVKDQGYDNIPEVEFYVDFTNGDNIWEPLTFENFINFPTGGINYWSCHGSMDEIDDQGNLVDGFITLCYYNTPYLINNYFPDDIPSGFEEYTYIYPHENGWTGSNPASFIGVKPEAATIYWEESIDEIKPITIIEACYSYQNGFVEACGNGGATFGYYNQYYYNPATKNYFNLFKRLNGKIDSEDSFLRSTVLAFTDTDYEAGFKMYPPDANITLCPATKFYAPENNALVPPEVTSGFFETDTWCDATIPANEALTFSVTGDINVNNVYWENNTNGKANKIAYEWSGTQGSVTVHVHTDKIVAYGGGGQKLDFDRKTPNGEANAYYIFRVGYGTNEVVDFNVNDYSIFANTTVDFTNTSTIENPLSYHWDFGDGDQSSEQNPSHIYTEPGVYDVSLFINTPVGMQYETKLAYISVYGSDIGSMSCSAELNNDRTIIVYADISSSYADLISEYRFAIDFGNGDIEIVEGISNSVQVTYTYDDYGIFTPEVFADVFFSSGGETFSTGCVCNSVELYNPFPCSNLEANFSISPANAYLTGINSNPTATVNFSDLTMGGANYTWDWYFLAEPEIGYEPSGGISHECYVESWGYNGNPQSKTYNHAGIYPVMLHVTDGNGCTDFVTHYVNIAHPLHCINNLKILSSGSDQLWSSNRLIVPWQQNNEECTLSLSNTFDHLIYCMNCNCNVCGETGQCFNWYINGENVKNGILNYYPVESGHTDLTNIEIESFDWLLPYKNQISLALFGRIYDENLTSINCYDSTNIEVLAVNCAGTMNSDQLVYSYLASNNAILPDFSANGYMINKNSWKEFYSGHMNLNSGVNQIVNSNDVSLLACDGIILTDGFKTGSGKFIAGSASDGATLEGCYHNQNFYNVVNDNPSTDNNLEPELKITPNPVSDIFTIIVTHNVGDFLRLEIFDSNSRLIKTVYNDYIEYGIYEFQVNDFNYNPGMYYCRYSNSQQTISEKFIRTQDNDK
jgi:PKD repeat protein